MNKVRLGDVCQVVSGSTPKSSNSEYWDGPFNWVTPAELSDSTLFVLDTERKITQKGIDSCALTLMPVGTVLLSSRAPIGKVAITGVEMYCNQGFKNLICSDKINNHYLYWFLKAKKQYLNSLGRGATFKEISKSIVENIEIPYPSIEQQIQIASILFKINETITLCGLLITKMDELIKSRFVEMFGDMIINPFDWKRDKLGKVCDVRDGTHDSPSYYDEGYPLVTSKNVTNGTISFNDCNYICEADFNKINERSKVDIGDILMPMIGTIGKPVIVKTDKPFAIKNVALVKFYPNGLVENVYIHTILKSDYFDRMVISKIRGGTQKFIALGDIRELTISIPPIELQNQFADFVTQVEKQKATVQQSIDKLETLKKSLMQEYFG